MKDPLRKLRPPSPKQKAARDRNWRVWKLRGLYWNCFPMEGEHRDAYRAAIDAQLAALGAEPETQRDARKRREVDRYETFRAAVVGEFLV